MKRCVSGFAVAFACVLTAGLSAQDTQVKTQTKVKADDAKVVTFTGCLQAGTESPSFVLAKAVPVSKTTTAEAAVGTSGTAPTVTTTTTTTYALVPSNETIDLQTHVGHKVEVTGLVIDAASGGDKDAKIKTETKTESKDVKSKETKESEVPRGDSPQMKVLSIKALGEPCTM